MLDLVAIASVLAFLAVLLTFIAIYAYKMGFDNKPDFVPEPQELEEKPAIRIKGKAKPKILSKKKKYFFRPDKHEDHLQF